jgi:type I restriction enzyme S subunit
MREALVKTEEFKDSPVGKIPKDWDVCPLKDLTDSRDSITYGVLKPGEYIPDGIPLLQIQDVIHGNIEPSKLHRISKELDTQYARTRLYGGEIVMSLVGTIGKIAQIPDSMAGANLHRNLARIPISRGNSSRFVFHYLQSQTVQEAIAHTSSLIAKLKQMKAGLLHDLLTRGLDENGELRDAIGHPEQFKDSLLGQIPKDWEIRTCESVCREIVVGIVIKPSQYYQSSGVPALRSANVREAGLNPSDLVFISEQSNRLLAKSMIRTGDLLTVRTGYPGTSCVVPPEFDGANCVDIIISRPGAEIESAFLATWINSDFGKGQVLRVQGGLAQQHFNVGELQKLVIAKPSIEEQRAIQIRLEAYETRIRTEEAYREKLKLQKQGLMHDLLTGKVRVKI